MKLTKLLVLGALLLMGNSAFAVDLVPREAPTAPETSVYDLSVVDKTPADYQQDTKAYVLYNIGAERLFIAGNDYETRASLGETGALVYFLATDAAKEKGEGVVELKNYVPKFSEFRSAFAGGVSDFWTDNNGRGDRFWKVTVAADKTVRIQNVVAETDKFVGWNGAEDDSRLYLLAADAEGAAIDWQLFEVKEWSTYLNEQAVYSAAEKLAKAIENAQAVKANVDAQIAVYNNQGSSIAELEAAVEAANQAANEARESGLGAAAAAATGSNPVDLTAYLIKNASYDEETNDGWSGDVPAFQSYNDAEFYNKNFNYYQNIANAPKGIYALQVQGYYRAGSAAASYESYKTKSNGNAILYASCGEDSLAQPLVNIFAGASAEKIGVNGEMESNGVYIPNTMESARGYFDNGRYNNTLFFENNADAIRIGLLKNSQLDTDWTIWDNWKLIYYGAGDDALQAWIDGVIANAPNYDDLDEDTKYSWDVMEAYEAVIEEAANATTKEEILAASEKIDAAATALQANLVAWQDFLKSYANAEEIAADPTLNPVQEDVMNLSDEVRAAEDMLEDYSLSTEEILAEIKKLDEMATLATKNGMDTTGDATDVTKRFLKNTDYSDGTNGWQGASSITGVNANTAEAFEKNPFDMYQIVEGAPVGVYEVQLNAFFRNGANQSAYDEYLEAVQSGTKIAAPAQVYMNNKATDICNVFEVSYPEGEVLDANDVLYKCSPFTQEDAWGNKIWFVNEQKNSARAFANGDYMQSAFGMVAKSGDALRVGIKGALTGGQWACWSNIKLIYHGMKADIVKEVLAGEVESAETLTSTQMAASVKQQLTDAINAAKEAMNGEDGDAMFACLNDLYDAEGAIATSKEAYAKLVSAVDNLRTAIQEAEDATAEAKANAGAVADEVERGIDQGAYANDEIDAVIVKLGGAKTALFLPNDINTASEANPVDVSKVIANNSYDNNDNAGWSGTNPGFQTFTNAEVYNAVFDVYQDIVALPAGVYTLEVQAFHRYGFAANDYTTYTADPTANNVAYVYAVIGNDTVTTNVARLASDAVTVEADAAVPGGFTWADEANRIAVPNNMESAENTFNEGKYNNAITFNVPENVTLRIGIKKESNIDGSWAIWDNWRLTYLGANADGVQSVKTLTGGKTEYYNLNGIRLSQPQKGIVIVKEAQADGTLKVKKINVK